MIKNRDDLREIINPRTMDYPSDYMDTSLLLSDHIYYGDIFNIEKDLIHSIIQENEEYLLNTIHSKIDELSNTTKHKNRSYLVFLILVVILSIHLIAWVVLSSVFIGVITWNGVIPWLVSLPIFLLIIYRLSMIRRDDLVQEMNYLEEIYECYQ